MMEPDAQIGAREPDIDDLRSAVDLRALNDVLTKSMAQQRIQGLIKGGNLELVANEITGRAALEGPEGQLVAAAMLGRLVAVARGREAAVLSLSTQLFLAAPPPLDSLRDGDEKLYAAQFLRAVRAEWVLEYCLREALEIESADKARKELLSIALGELVAVASWLRAIGVHAVSLRALPTEDAQLKRSRRVMLAALEAVTEWQGELGDSPGPALSECFRELVVGRLEKPDTEVLFDILDGALTLLSRLIQLRFSIALYAPTYAIVTEAKKVFGLANWSQFLNASRSLHGIQTDMLEAALVLARQNRTDGELMGILTATYVSRAQTGTAIRRHFVGALDLDPDVREWWQNAGVLPESHRQLEHKVGNTEDQQIGALLIEVESSREAMEKISRAIVPYLEISDPVLAATAKRAAAGYVDMAQIAARLARMRKLTKTDLKNARVEYNPLEHEMLGGHKAGIRRVKVVRDGIQKEFGGRKKTLVKPWVEPDE